MYDWKYYTVCAKELKDNQVNELRRELDECANELKKCNEKFKLVGLINIIFLVVIIVLIIINYK